MDSQMDIKSCTDACTHSKQGVGNRNEVTWDTNTLPYRSTQLSIKCTTVCLCPSHLISVWTPCLGCVHASVHVCMSTWLPMLAKHPMDSYMERWVPVCGNVCVCLSHPACCPIPWLKCVHGSVHVYRSTWLQKCAPPPMDSYIETWVLLYGTVYVLHSPHFCSNTLFRMCTFISTCTYVNMGSKFLCTPFA